VVPVGHLAPRCQRPWPRRIYRFYKSRKICYPVELYRCVGMYFSCLLAQDTGDRDSFANPFIFMKPINCRGPGTKSWRKCLLQRKVMCAVQYIARTNNSMLLVYLYNSHCVNAVVKCTGLGIWLGWADERYVQNMHGEVSWKMFPCTAEKRMESWLSDVP